MSEPPRASTALVRDVVCLRLTQPSSLFQDDMHPTAAGHALLGDAFAVARVPEPKPFALLPGRIGVVARAARRRPRGAH